MRTIVHLSDLHFGRLDPVVVAPLCAAIDSASPDLIAISGDFTQRAKRSEFVAARAFLNGLRAPKLLVPGNHDVPLWNVGLRMIMPLRRYQRYISPELEPEYVDDEIIALGVNTARVTVYGGGGRINATQISRIVTRFAAAPQALVRIIVTHHPFDLPPGVRERRLLGRAEMAMAGLTLSKPDLFLSGHLHLSHASRSSERYGMAGHAALIVQAGTVSRRGRGEQPSFNLLRVHDAEIALARFVWEPSTLRFTLVEIGRYYRNHTGWCSVDPDGPLSPASQ